MRYARGQDILPAKLLIQLQQYIDGAYLYIPRKKENRLTWGERTHSKEETAARNRAIFLEAEAGVGISALAKNYFLAEKTVRRILLEERKKQNN